MPDPERGPDGAIPIEPRYLGLGELFFQIRDAVIVGDAGTGRVVLWNAAASQIFGYDQQEAASLRIEDLVPPSLKRAHREGINRFAASGRGELIDSSRTVELPALRKDGTEIVVELTLTPLETKRLLGRFAMAIVRDVTERKQSEQRVQGALELERETSAKLRDLDALKNTFVATVVHDVRSPMAAVIGFAELLREHFDELKEGDRERLLNGILRSSRGVLQLVEDVLQVAALDSGEIPYTIGPMDISATIERVLDEARAARPDVSFGVTTQERLSPVLADPERVWQVLSNLVSNSVRFTADGGRIEIDARESSAHVVTSVRDEGPGIAEADRHRLFEKFSRMERNAGSGVRGTGLGLYICRALVEVQGGRIWLEDAPGKKGATFAFSLPIAGGPGDAESAGTLT